MPVFVDTNVLVYSRDSSEAAKQPVARGWLERLFRSGDGRVSMQVLNEYYVTVTAKLVPGLPVDEARADVRDLLLWRPQPVDADLLEIAWRLESRFRLSFWDALIVAAAQTAGCEQLLTEDLQDGQDFDGTVAVNPFR